MPINTNVVKTWLKAGVVYKGKYSETTLGVPQGGPISPTIFNIVMNGIEAEILKIKLCTPVRFADDIIVMARTNEQLENTLEQIKNFLKPRGLEINEENLLCLIDYYLPNLQITPRLPHYVKATDCKKMV